ncbi:MAG: peptidylprolyl isomerase [Verrucomicrobia bacterium]|jgi:peptidyl-prolyl cis-trans isomerase A (cyclophilin A)|nr:peptidylprolyl isomerase [Verrucomicrobiota bacterium]
MSAEKFLRATQPLWLCCLLLLAFVSPSRAGTLAQFRTTVGDIEVELLDQDKPVTVANFKRYVQGGAYVDSIFHRVTTNNLLVIQGGWLTVSNRASITNWSSFYIPTFPPITNEFGVGTFYSNDYGTIAMAKTSDPNSATSQFFFNLTNNAAALDNTNNSGGFTVFGRVVRGTNILNKLNAVHPTAAIQSVLLGGAFNEFPLLLTAQPPLIDSDEMVYVDITLLSVQIALTNNLREISWNSLSGLTNVVEYTTNLPPSWNTLVTTNGTGSRLAVTDPSPTNLFRFYRVRVLY